MKGAEIRKAEEIKGRPLNRTQVILLNYLNTNAGLHTGEEIYLALRNQGISVSYAGIYLNLSNLVLLGLVDRIIEENERKFKYTKKQFPDCSAFR